MIAAVPAVIGGMYGGGSWVDNRYAHTAEMHDHKAELILIEMRLDQKIMNDRVNALQNRIWKMEERYGPQMELAKEGRDDAAMEEYRALMTEKHELERQLQNIESRIMEQEYGYNQMEQQSQQRSRPRLGK